MMSRRAKKGSQGRSLMLDALQGKEWGVVRPPPQGLKLEEENEITLTYFQFKKNKQSVRGVIFTPSPKHGIVPINFFPITLSPVLQDLCIFRKLLQPLCVVSLLGKCFGYQICKGDMF